VNEQLDSQAFFHHIENELRDKHVIFCSIEEAFVKHFTLVKKYFGKLVPYTDNKYAALNTAV
jgi:Fe-S cluster assembly protein SufB